MTALRNIFRFHLQFLREKSADPGAAERSLAKAHACAGAALNGVDGENRKATAEAVQDFRFRNIFTATDEMKRGVAMCCSSLEVFTFGADDGGALRLEVGVCF